MLDKLALLFIYTFSFAQVMLKGDTAFVAPFNLEKKVNINKFKLSEKTVSNTDYLEFVKANPDWSKSKVLRIFADKNYLAHWQNDYSFGTDSLLIKDAPVVNVSWFAANAYANWRGGRLPCLFEWEYAASAEPDTLTTHFKTLAKLATNWMQEASPKYFPPAGTVYRNQFGLYDLLGSVWEWVNDFNSVMMAGDSRSSREIDRSMFCGTPNVNINQLTNYSEFWRYAYRSSLKANYCLKNLGFRIAY